MSTIIGIGGVSRSGKTRLAYKISGLFPNHSVLVMNQDEYVFEVEEIPQVRGETDWECPESIDFDHLYEHIILASDTTDIVILEGLLAFYDPKIEKLMNKKIFVEIPKSLFLERKINDKRWGDFPEWYMDHIWQSYEKYGKIDPADETYFIVNGENIQITDDLRNYLLDA